MTLTWLDAYIQTLSVAPVFDEGLPAITAPFAEELATGAGPEANRTLSQLRRGGLLAGRPGAWRIAQPLRHESLRSLQAQPDIYSQVVSEVLGYLTNGYRERLNEILGQHGARLATAVLETATDADDRREPPLVELVESGAREGRRCDELSAAHLLAELPASESRSRQIEFFLGLSAWRFSRRQVAQQHFRRVLESSSVDLESGIAAHLSGVAYAQQGSPEQALQLLERAVIVLSALEDSRGLAMTLTSLGRVRRDRGLQLRSEADATSRPDVESVSVIAREAAAMIDQSISDLQRAIDYGASLFERRLEGLALIELAVTYQRIGSIDEAIQLAEAAQPLLGHVPGSDGVRVRLALGSIYRDAGDVASAGRVLGEAVELAAEAGEVSLDLAKALNVLASNERRAGLQRDAVKHATTSVALGRSLGDKRHVAHALHTLASALLDVGNRAEAEGALSEAERILTDLRDSRGVEMVRTTQQRLGT